MREPVKQIIDSLPICGIYKIISPTGKIYIGQSIDINRRWKDHKCDKYRSKFQSSIKKHGFENHKFEIKEECLLELLNERERHWQDFYDVLGENGLNLVLTNTKEKKYVFSEEAINKIKNNRKKLVFTEKQKQNLREKNLGKKLSNETKEKIRIGNLGNTNSKNCNLGSKNSSSRKVINTETGEIFDTIKDAAISKEIRPCNLGEKLRGSIKNNTTFKYYL